MKSLFKGFLLHRVRRKTIGDGIEMKGSPYLSKKKSREGVRDRGRADDDIDSFGDLNWLLKKKCKSNMLD